MKIEASILLALCAAYLLGSVPSAVWLSKGLFKKDVRSDGSRNAGLTNMYRLFGWKASLPVAIIDLGKGILAAWLGVHTTQGTMEPRNFALFTGCAGILGHSYTCLAGFKGGKGVLTGLGVYLFLTPYSAIGAFSVWTAVVIPSGYVSLASIAAAFSISMFVFFEWKMESATSMMLVITFILSGFIIIRHKSNIHRLLTGTESSFRKKKTIPPQPL